MPLINLATIHLETETRTKELTIFLGQQTQNKLQSSADFNKERVFARIKGGADQLLHHVSARGTGGESSSNQYANNDYMRLADDQVEEQPLPRYIFGMEPLRRRLHELLKNNPMADDGGCKRIGIWAKGGAGKTLLVQTVMNDVLIRAHFEYRVYMVHIGDTQNAVQVQCKLAQKIDSSAAWNAKTEEEGKTDLLNILKRKHPSRGKCLFILDDVWEADILSWLDDVLNENEGCCIVVTTRNQDVVRRLQAAELRVGMLSQEDSTKLFCVHAFNRNEDVHPALRGVVENIVKECGGLPLALKVVGGALAATPVDRPDQWDLALRKLQEAMGLDESHETRLYRRLKLSYDYLLRLDGFSSSGRLHRECFLYFAAFPEDTPIPTQDLINLWIAEGLLDSTVSEVGMDPETAAYAVLAILIARSLVELDSKEWSRQHNVHLLTCKVHDVIRDLALHIIQSETAEIWEKSCLFKAGWWKTPVRAPGAAAGRNIEYDTNFPPRRRRFKELLKETRKLSLVDSNIASLPHSKVSGAPPLKVLLLQNNLGLTKIPNAFLASFKQLTILDLSSTGLAALPSSLGTLRNLTFLNLRDNHSLQSLPASLGRLTNLLHLDLYNCGIKSLPPGKALTKLVNLTYLNTKGCGQIWEARRSAAAGLWCVSFGEYSTSIVDPMEELAALTKLRKLWIWEGSRQSIPGEAVGKLMCLRYANLSFPRLPAVPDELQALVNLETLDLNSCSRLVELPEWIGERMTCLKFLDLRGCFSIIQLHQNLNQLTNLKKLDLTGCSGILELPACWFSNYSFPLLEELWLQGCARLKKFPEVAEGALSCLATLNISYSSSLDTLPDSFPHLGVKLTHLNMGNCGILNVDHISLHHLSAFVCLQELILKNSPRLTVLPRSVVSLPKLAKLDIGGCPNLKKLPEPSDFQLPDPSNYFPSLEELVAAESGLEDIPASVIDIPTLKLLNLRDCEKLLYISGTSTQEPAWRAQARTRSHELVVLG
ncbi:hypothetical protein KP509_01G123500 [Ceratopteris richardii]|nr:hypothetical protein KP509_01G123500 [Ceratopteris richardii]